MKRYLEENYSSKWSEWKGTMEIMTFTSGHDVAKYLNNTPRPEGRGDSSETSSGSWGGRAYDKCLEMAVTGDKAVMKELRSIEHTCRAKIPCNGKSNQRTKVTNMERGNLIMSEYLRGNPKCLVRTKKAATKRGIHIVYDLSATCGVSAQDITKGGHTMAEVVVALQQHGYDVKFDIVFFSSNQNHRREHNKHCFIATVNLKEYGRQLNLQALSFLACDVGAFRRLGFAMLERHEGEWYDWTNHCYGQNCSEQAELINKGEDGHMFTLEIVRSLRFDPKRVFESIEYDQYKVGLDTTNL